MTNAFYEAFGLSARPCHIHEKRSCLQYVFVFSLSCSSWPHPLPQSPCCLLVSSPLTLFYYAIADLPIISLSLFPSFKTRWRSSGFLLMRLGSASADVLLLLSTLLLSTLQFWLSTCVTEALKVQVDRAGWLLLGHWHQIRLAHSQTSFVLWKS